MSAQRVPVAVDIVNAGAWQKLRGRACQFAVWCDDVEFRWPGTEHRCDQCRTIDRLEQLFHRVGDVDCVALQPLLAELDGVLSDYLEGGRP